MSQRRGEDAAALGVQLSDEQLLDAYRENPERDLFAQLVARYERELYNYLRRYLGNSELAEDVFQTTFLQVHLKLAQFDGDRKFRPWLYAIATNQAIDAQRRVRRHRMVSLDRPVPQDGQQDVGQLVDLLVSDDRDPLERVNQLEREQLVREALASLPEQMRLVVDLVYYQGLRYREAAEVLSIPVGTVKSRLHTAIVKLNECLHQSGGLTCQEPYEKTCLATSSEP